MNDIDKHQREFYSRASQWFKDNKIQTGTHGLVTLSLFVTALSLMAAIYFMFNSNSLSKEVKFLEREANEHQFELSEMRSDLERAKISAKKIVQPNVSRSNLARSKNSDTSRIERELSSAKNDAAKAKSDANMWMVKHEAAQMKVDNANNRYEILSQQFKRLDLQVEKIEQRYEVKFKAAVLAAITPVWFENSHVFENRAAIVLAVSANEEIKRYLANQVEYAYYEIELSNGKTLKVTSEGTQNEKRGFYQIGYAENASGWNEATKFAYVKLLGETTPRVIKFY